MHESLDLILKGINLTFSIIPSLEQVKKSERHNFIISQLYATFKNTKYKLFKEYSIQFRSKYRSRKRFGEVRKCTGGLIDLYLRGEDHEVAIEFDNGPSIKWKSVEKLFQCDADYCIALVHGSKTIISSLSFRDVSLRRMQKVLEELIEWYDKGKQYSKLVRLLNKQLWFGIMNINELIAINPKYLLKI